MSKFHINKHGVPALCKAKPGNCPLGGDETHFGSREEAQEAINKINEEKHGLLSEMREKTKENMMVDDEVEKHNIISNIDRMIKIKECTIHEEGMSWHQLINRAKIQGIIEGLKIARKIVLRDKNMQVVRGEWKLYGNDDDSGMSYWCTVCNFQLSEDLFYSGYKNGRWIKNGVFKYCPNCGAEMEQ